MNNIGASLDNNLKSRATNLHSNSAALSKQQDALVKETGNLKKETDKLGKVANEMSKQLKELGNVQNWAEMLERDFLVVEDTLRRVREGSVGSSWSGSGSSWSEDDEGQDGKERRDGEGDVKMGGMDDTNSSDVVNGDKDKGVANGIPHTNGSSISHIAAKPEPDVRSPTI